MGVTGDIRDGGFGVELNYQSLTVWVMREWKEVVTVSTDMSFKKSFSKGEKKNREEAGE